MTMAPERAPGPAAEDSARPQRSPWRGHGRGGAPAVPQQGDPASSESDDRPERPLDSAELPCLAEGVELVGEYEGSGYKEPHHLARRSNGALIQLTDLLHMVAVESNGTKTMAQIAEAVSVGFGQNVNEDNVRQLVDENLRPLGVLADASGRSPEVAPPDPLLGLKFRCTLLSARGTRFLTSLFTPLFVPVLVAVVLAALAAFDVWLFLVHGLAEGLRQTVQQPIIFLMVVGIIVVSAALHEIGHAAACRYSGAIPGRMGAGLYVAWPAFYTDVTDAYRLDRRGRLRTDLGGVYFNAIVVLIAGSAFFLTSYEPLLLVCFALQMQIVQQMLPLLRLDGYYVLSDMVGVPDLFKRIGPILRSALPWRGTHPLVAELKPHVRVVVTLWVLAIVPLLLINLVFIVFHAPRILATAWDSAARQWGIITTESGLALAVGALQLVVLLIPTLGAVITMVRVGRRSAVGAWTWSARSPVRRFSVMTGTGALLVLLAFAWWPDGRLTPYRPGEHGTVRQGVTDASSFRQGAPLLRSPQEAQQPLPTVKEGTSAVTGPEAGTTPGSGPAPGTAPAPGTEGGNEPDATTGSDPSETPAGATTSSDPSETSAGATTSSDPSETSAGATTSADPSETPAGSSPAPSPTGSATASPTASPTTSESPTR